MQLIPSGQSLLASESLLHEIACRMTGLDDFGDSDYLAGLRILLRSYDEDVDLTEQGRTMSAGMCIVALAGRLTSEAAWAAHPEYRDVEIERPVIIIGLPRTGTTALHRMLCRDAKHQGLELWLAQTPMPRPPRISWEQSSAYRQCQNGLEAQYAASPEMESIHEMAADEVDECWNLLRQDFTSVTFECAAGVTQYAQWWAECDMSRAYARWADNLRLIGANDREKRWILKDPSHLFALEELLEQFPNAIFLMTHRDPARSIPSVCSLNATARNTAIRTPDPIALGIAQNELWARGIERTMAVRKVHPDRFIDIHFDALISRPLDTIEEIYHRIGESLSREAEESVSAWLAENQSSGHRYDAFQYGLRKEEIRERYSEYIRVCGVQIENQERLASRFDASHDSKE
jgi:hypothetical protein